MANSPPINPYDWLKYRMLREGAPDLAERGRLLAAQAMATDPEARKRVEDAIGVPMAAQMYPECYRNIGRRTGVVRFLDFVRTKIPW